MIGTLDYVRDLGLTALWQPPFYPSPLKDDGYDIASCTGVHPAYSTLRDFQRPLTPCRTDSMHEARIMDPCGIEKSRPTG